MRLNLRKSVYGSLGFMLVLLGFWIYRWDSVWIARRHLHFMVPDEYAVYSASMDMLWASWKNKPKAVLVLDKTESQKNPSLKGNFKSIKKEERLRSLKKATLDDYNTQNANHSQLTREIVASAICIPISQVHLENIVRRDILNWGKEVESEYPDVEAVIRFSRVGFSRNFGQAVVWVQMEVTYGGGGGFYHVLEKRNDRWRVIDGFQAIIF